MRQLVSRSTPTSAVRQMPILALFGRSSLLDESGQIVPLPKNAFVILSMAIYNNRYSSIAKNTVSDVLWNGLDREKQRSNLRTVIKRIRRTQESHNLSLFTFERDQIKIDVSAIDCDLRFVLQTVKLGESGNVPRAAQFKFESLLEGYERVSVPLENWLVGAREQITDRVIELICKTLETRRFYRNPELELSLAKRVLEMNPIAEEPYRIKLLIYRLASDRISLEGALAQLMAAYQRNLDSAPPPQLVANYEDAIKELRKTPSASTNSVEVFSPASLIRSHLYPSLTLHRNIQPQDAFSAQFDTFVAEVVTLLWKARSIRLVESSMSESVRLKLLRGPADHAYDLNVSAFGGHSARISLSLSHRSTAAVVWADSFTLQRPDLESTARSAAQSITQGVEIHQIQRSAAISDGAESPFVLVANANRQLMQVDLPSLRRARRLFRSATATDGGNVPALTGLARTYWLEWLVRAGADKSLLTTALEIGRKALILSPDSHLSHRELGMIALYARRHDLALEHLSRALDLLPGDPNLTFDFADALVSNGQGREGMMLARKVGGIDLPPGTFGNWVTASGLYLLGEYADAIEELSRMQNQSAGYRLRAACHAMLGETELADSFRRMAMEDNPTFSVESWLNVFPIREPASARHAVEGFLKAGFK